MLRISNFCFLSNVFPSLPSLTEQSLERVWSFILDEWFADRLLHLLHHANNLGFGVILFGGQRDVWDFLNGG